jgi:hypothetical protein
MLPFGIQIAPPVVSFVAVIAVVPDRFVQVCLGFLDRMLAVRPVIGVGLRRSRYEPHKRRCDQGCYCRFSKASFQGVSSSIIISCSIHFVIRGLHFDDRLAKFPAWFARLRLCPELNEV